MLAIPAIELSDGRAVRLAGDRTSERSSIGDARDIARRWTGYGFARLHIVDLDAAVGRGSNDGVVRDLLWDQAAPMQVGGGIATTEAVSRLLDDGARWVVVGTRAVRDGEWLAELADANPGGILVAIDLLGRRVLVKNAREWARELPRDVLDFVETLAGAGVPLGGLLVTSTERAGQLRGIDLPLMEDIAEASPWPVFAAGGIAGIGDLRALEDRGVSGAVIGMALHTGALDPRVTAGEFAE